MAGPSAAVLSYNDPKLSLHVDESCKISGSIAVCSAEIVTGTATSYTSQITETVLPMEVQPYNQQSPSSATPSSDSPVASSTSAPTASAHSSALLLLNPGMNILVGIVAVGAALFIV